MRRETELPPISDEELVASIKQGIKEAEEGMTYSLEEVDRYFEQKSILARAEKMKQSG